MQICMYVQLCVYIYIYIWAILRIYANLPDGIQLKEDPIHIPFISRSYPIQFPSNLVKCHVVGELEYIQ